MISPLVRIPFLLVWLLLGLPRLASAQIGSWTQAYSINWKTAGLGGAAVSAGSTGTSTTGLGPGWTDVQGNVGSVASALALMIADNATAPYLRCFVTRPTGEVTQNQRVVWVIPPYGGSITSSAPVWWSGLRFQASSKSYYLIGLNAGSSNHAVNAFRVTTGTGATTLSPTNASITYDATKYYLIDESVTSAGLVNTIRITITPYTGDPNAGGSAGTTQTLGNITDNIPSSGNFSDMNLAGQTAVVAGTITPGLNIASFTAYNDSGQTGLSAGAITANATTSSSITPQIASITGGTGPYSTLFSYSTTTNGTYTQIGTAVTGANPVANAAATGLSASTAYFFRAVTTDSSGTPITTTFPSTSTGTSLSTSAAISATITEQNLPANHLGNITVHAVGVGTSWTSSTTWTPSNVAGWTVASKTFVDTTHYTLVLTGPTAGTGGAVGTLNFTEGVTGSTVATTVIATPTLAVSPTSKVVSSGATTITFTGANTLWATDNPQFTISALTGTSMGASTQTSNTASSGTLTVGSTVGSTTFTDPSTGATASFSVSASTLALTYPLAEPVQTTSSIAVTFSWTGGAANYSLAVYRSTTPNFTPGGGNLQTTITGITGLTATYTDSTSLVTDTVYYYKALLTDSLSASVSSAWAMSGSLLTAKYILGIVGDSIGAGANVDTVVTNGTNVLNSVGASNSPTRNPGITLAAVLQAMRPSISVSYVAGSGVGASGCSNQSVSGKTTTDWWNGTTGQYTTAKTNWDAMSPKPNMFHILLGANDSRTDKAIAAGAIGTAGSYADNLQKLTTKLLTDYPGCLVILHKPLYYTPGGTNTSGTTTLFTEASLTTYLAAYPAAIDAVVASFSGSNPNQVYAGDRSGYGFFASKYNAPGAPELVQEQYGSGATFFLHPNAQGASDLGRLWATATYNALFAPTTTTNFYRRGLLGQ